MTRHSTDYLSLGFGLIFAAVAAGLLFGDLAAMSWEWLGPVVVIGIGAIVILAARPGRRADPQDAA